MVSEQSNAGKFIINVKYTEEEFKSISGVEFRFLTDENMIYDLLAHPAVERRKLTMNSVKKTILSTNKVDIHIESFGLKLFAPWSGSRSA